MKNPIFTQFQYSDSDSPHHEHYHLSGEMVFVEEGEAEFVISGKTYRAGKTPSSLSTDVILSIPVPGAPAGPASPCSPLGITKVSGSTLSSVKYIVTNVEPFSPELASTLSIVNPSLPPPNSDEHEVVKIKTNIVKN